MQRMKGKCATARRFLTFCLVTVFAVALAYGQTQATKFNVPYSFTVGSTVLPAGAYTFTISRGAFSTLTVQSGTKAPARVSILTWINGPNELFAGGSLIFDKTEKGLTLSEVWLSEMDGALVHPVPRGGDRIVISGTSLDQNRTYSGKAAYNLTCAKCHGDNGKGNPEADKFFGITIPRLNSSAVQSMSDAELRQQINQGGSAMPPVEIDESGFRHRLPPQDVDAVIAYMRSLKG